MQYKIAISNTTHGKCVYLFNIYTNNQKYLSVIFFPFCVIRVDSRVKFNVHMVNDFSVMLRIHEVICLLLISPRV